MMKRLLALILAVSIILTVGTCAFAAEESTPETKSLIDSSAIWSYLDNNTDPAGDSSAADYNRTAWTRTDYDDSQWSTAAGLKLCSTMRRTDLHMP